MDDVVDNVFVACIKLACEQTELFCNALQGGSVYGAPDSSLAVYNTTRSIDGETPEPFYPAATFVNGKGITGLPVSWASSKRSRDSIGCIPSPILPDWPLGGVNEPSLNSRAVAWLQLCGSAPAPTHLEALDNAKKNIITMQTERNDANLASAIQNLYRVVSKLVVSIVELRLAAAEQRSRINGRKFKYAYVLADKIPQPLPTPPVVSYEGLRRLSTPVRRKRDNTFETFSAAKKRPHTDTEESMLLSAVDEEKEACNRLHWNISKALHGRGTRNNYKFNHPVQVQQSPVSLSQDVNAEVRGNISTFGNMNEDIAELLAECRSERKQFDSKFN